MAGQSGATQQQNQYTSLAPWAQPYVTSMLGAGQAQVFNTDQSGNITGINPYNAYGSINADTGGQYGMTASDQAAANASVAGFSPLQQQSYQGASNLQTPGQFGMGTGAAGMGTMQALGAGQNLQNTLTNPYSMSQYMNPYIQNTLNPSLQLLGQQTGIQGAAEQGAATSKGAFGGSREALMNNLNQQSGNIAAQQMIGNAYNNAYTNAQQQANNVANLGLQGAGQAISGANTLGNLGTSQLAAQQGILGLQNTYGGQQQQQAQNVINQAMQNYSTAQQYPMTQLNQLKNLISGVPVTDTTTTVQQAAPSATSTLAGLGTAGIAGLGLYNASQGKTSS